MPALESVEEKLSEETRANGDGDGGRTLLHGMPDAERVEHPANVLDVPLIADACEGPDDLRRRAVGRAAALGEVVADQPRSVSIERELGRNGSRPRPRQAQP